MADTERDEDGNYTGPGEKTIPLRTSITRADGNAATSITINEPNGKQLSAYFKRKNETSDDGIEATILLISLTSGWIPADAEKLKQRDLDACGEFLAGFSKVPPKSASAILAI